MTEIDPANVDPSTDCESENSGDVEQLVWMLLDERMSDEQFQQLDKLLRQEASARATYVKCVGLHADLTEHFSPDKDGGRTTAQRSPVLGFLSQADSASSANLPTLDTPPPGV